MCIYMYVCAFIMAQWNVLSDMSCLQVSWLCKCCGLFFVGVGVLGFGPQRTLAGDVAMQGMGGMRGMQNHHRS